MSPMNQRTLRPSANLRYWQKIANALGRSTIVEHWTFAEKSGATINGVINGYNVAQSGLQLDNAPGPGGHNAPLFDGANDYVNVYSAGLAAALNGQECTVFIPFKVAAAGVWADGVARKILRLRVDAANEIAIARTAANNTLQFYYAAQGAAAKTVDWNSGGDTNWLLASLSISKTANEMKAYINKTQVGTTQSGFGAFTGLLATTLSAIGSNAGNSAAFPWSGWIADVIIRNRASSLAEIGTVYDLLMAGANP
jgi:hypothetical protein